MAKLAGQIHVGRKVIWNLLQQLRFLRLVNWKRSRRSSNVYLVLEPDREWIKAQIGNVPNVRKKSSSKLLDVPKRNIKKISEKGGLRCSKKEHQGCSKKEHQEAPVIIYFRDIKNRDKNTPSSSSSSASVVRVLRLADPAADDDVARELIRRCRKVEPTASDEEIWHFIQLKSSRRGIKNPLGFLLTAVPKCFKGESLRQHRQEVQANNEKEIQRYQELTADLQKVLDNPDSDERSRQWALEVLRKFNQ
jgi:hypothetical protein